MTSFFSPDQQADGNNNGLPKRGADILKEADAWRKDRLCYFFLLNARSDSNTARKAIFFLSVTGQEASWFGLGTTETYIISCGLAGSCSTFF